MKEMSLEFFDRNVDLDKRFVPGEHWTAKFSCQRVPQYWSRVSERLVQDSSTGCNCRTEESDGLRRYGAVSWLNSKEAGEI